MTTINLSSFNFESVNLSVIAEAVEYLKDFLVDTESTDYLCDVANESLGCDPYVIYHSKAKDWLKMHNLDTFDVIEDVREYHNINFGEFSLEINPETIVTAYMSTVLNDLVGLWLIDQLENNHDLDLWNEELTDETRKIIVTILSELAEELEDEDL